MIDLIFTALLWLAIAFFVVMCWALCKMASECDKISEEEWQEYLKKEGGNDESERVSGAD